MTAEQLGNLLVSVNIIDAAAIDDPEGYDECRTLRHLESIIPDIKAAFESERPKDAPNYGVATLRLPASIGLLAKFSDAFAICGIKANVRQEGVWLVFTVEGEYP